MSFSKSSFLYTLLLTKTMTNKENRMMILNLAEISRIEEFFERMLRDEVNESRRKISRSVCTWAR